MNGMNDNIHIGMIKDHRLQSQYEIVNKRLTCADTRTTMTLIQDQARKPIDNIKLQIKLML